MLNKSEIMKKWNAMTDSEKQLAAIAAGAGASLFFKGLKNMRNVSKHQMETINLVVPKNCELMIFVKGGK